MSLLNIFHTFFPVSIIDFEQVTGTYIIGSSEVIDSLVADSIFRLDFIVKMFAKLEILSQEFLGEP